MPKRFTESEKWKGPWFHKLSPAGKLFYLYIRDQCDLAGFWEIDLERAVFDTGYPRRTLEGALKEVERCYETNSIYLWISQFIKSQGNFPFKEKNRACQQIIKLFKERETFSKNITKYLNGEDLPSPFEGGNKGLFTSASNSIGISKGQGIGKGQGKEEDSKIEPSYTANNGKILKGKTLERFEKFLTAFGSRAGKASAANSWIKINPMTDELFEEIIAGAERYTVLRAGIVQRGGTPKMAQGWLTDRRWEDKVETVTQSEYEKARAFTQRILAKGDGGNGE